MKVNRKIYNKYWKDENGIIRPVPVKGKGLKARKRITHKILRDFVFRRDKYTCQHCGVVGESEYPFKIPRAGHGVGILVIDHILSIRNGGTNHPSNLQVLCHTCNSIKSINIDSKYKKRGNGKR